MIAGRRRVGLLAALLAACGTRPEPPSNGSALPAGVTARVGAELISPHTVSRIAEKQSLAPRAALSAAVSDALLANEARGAVVPGTASSIERAAAARSLLELLAREAEAAGPPSAAELGEILRERWAELDRPDAVLTTHAVVRNDKPEKAAEARRVAEKLAAAVKSATNADEFMRLAREVPAEGFEVRAEALPPMTADGRGVDKRGDVYVGRGSFDPDFARAANQLTTPGELSPVVQSPFGFHVIRLEMRIAGHKIPAADVPAVLGPEALNRRGARARRELLEKLKASVPVEIERAHDELTAKTKFAP